jgi:CheY-like chemotaxis protein
MKKYDATILVVEADEYERAFMERAFRQLGVKGPVQLLSSGDEAIAYMKGEGRYADRQKYAYPSFVLTALRMPHGDGFSVLAFLKRNPEWAVIPTVVLSGSASHAEVKKAYRLGASSYHRKPVGQDDFLKLLSILHQYWMTCEVPEVDDAGKQLPTHGEDSIGEGSADPAATSRSKPS